MSTRDGAMLLMPKRAGNRPPSLPDGLAALRRGDRDFSGTCLLHFREPQRQESLCVDRRDVGAVDRAESTLWLSEFSPNGLYHRSPRRKHAQSGPPPAINRRLAVDENLELAVGSTDQFNVSV